VSELREGLYEQETEISVLACLIPYVKKKEFIDVGAEKGEVSGWFMRHNFSGKLFEPLPKHHESIKLLIEGTESEFFPYAIDDHDHRGILHIATDDEGQPMDYFHSLQRLDHDGLVHHTQELEIECRSINSLIKDGTLSKSTGVFKTDTEGNDLRVLAGMGLLDADVLVCEFFTKGQYNGWAGGNPLWLVEEAAKLGFYRYVAIRRKKSVEFVTFSPVAFHDGEWGNLIFIKEDVFDLSVNDLLDVKKKSELMLVKKLEMLQDACDERLELINELHNENAKRLKIINRLSK